LAQLSQFREQFLIGLGVGDGAQQTQGKCQSVLKGAGHCSMFLMLVLNDNQYQIRGQLISSRLWRNGDPKNHSELPEKHDLRQFSGKDLLI
jgi:deoxyxylulose-5-phosphate synthase